MQKIFIPKLEGESDYNKEALHPLHVTVLQINQQIILLPLNHVKIKSQRNLFLYLSATSKKSTKLIIS